MTMSNMKRISATFSLVLGLGGCALFGGQSTIDSWAGHTSSDLIASWGPPSSIQRLPDGRTTVEFTSSHAVQGTSYDCRAWFLVSPVDVILKGSISGSIGGCNRLLSGKSRPE